MAFEFDKKKSLANKEKHGIDFLDAQDLWQDDDRIEVEGQDADEVRFIAVGKIWDRYWAAVTTNRADNIRIISVRPARRKERELYEEKKDNSRRIR